MHQFVVFVRIVDEERIQLVRTYWFDHCIVLLRLVCSRPCGLPKFWIANYTTAQLLGVIGAYDGGIDGLLSDANTIATFTLGAVEGLIGQFNQAIGGNFIRRGQCGNAYAQGDVVGDIGLFVRIAGMVYLID